MMLSKVENQLRRLAEKVRRGASAADRAPDKQDLDIYWNPQMAEALETWGQGNAWDEIQLLLVNCQGRVLDIACGTGTVMEVMSQYQQLEVYGCDISDFLISKAVDKGLERERMKVCDATATDYEDNFFDHSYSIGSLEHFTEDGIVGLLKEAKRITRYSSCHMIPVSRREDEGWISPNQSYFNNGIDWWLLKFREVFPEVAVLSSSWSDDRSVGKWFVCKSDSARDAG